MAEQNRSELALGINGFGRIGKLTVWNQVGRKYFRELVINIGRESGTSLADIAHYLARDSNYGCLHGYLYGHNALPVISEVDESSGRMLVDGMPVRFLREQRSPAAIPWRENGVRLVVDTTG